MSKLQSTLTLLMLGTTLAACGSDPTQPTAPPKTTPPGDQASAVVSTPGSAKECVDFLPSPAVGQETTADDPCPDSGSSCVNHNPPYVWCKADGTPAIVGCEMGAWVIEGKQCP